MKSRGYENSSEKPLCELLAKIQGVTANLPSRVSSLPIIENGEQFLRVIGILLYYVATIKLAHNENYPCLNPINMLL